MSNPRRTIRWQWWLVKGCGLGLIWLLVLYPRLDRLPVTLQRHRNPNALIEPDHPGLQPLITEFLAHRDAEWSDARQLLELQNFVYRKIPYEWDWNLWGNVDYFPTVGEALEKGREDCDGRAVVAASMLRNFGYDARLVSDLKHVWVETERGATMSPGAVSAVRFTDEGPSFDWGIVRVLPDALSLGVAVFPLQRELILVVATWLFLLSGGRQWGRGVPWILVVVIGVLLLRESYHGSPGRWTDVWKFSGAAALAVGALGSWVHGVRLRRFAGRSAEHAD